MRNKGVAWFWGPWSFSGVRGGVCAWHVELSCEWQVALMFLVGAFSSPFSLLAPSSPALLIARRVATLPWVPMWLRPRKDLWVSCGSPVSQQGAMPEGARRPRRSHVGRRHWLTAPRSRPRQANG
eukprot:7663171-Pyramimonas_sp.AAC.1